MQCTLTETTKQNYDKWRVVPNNREQTPKLFSCCCHRELCVVVRDSKRHSHSVLQLAGAGIEHTLLELGQCPSSRCLAAPFNFVPSSPMSTTAAAATNIPSVLSLSTSTTSCAAASHSLTTLALLTPSSRNAADTHLGSQSSPHAEHSVTPADLAWLLLLSPT